MIVGPPRVQISFTPLDFEGKDTMWERNTIMFPIKFELGNYSHEAPLAWTLRKNRSRCIHQLCQLIDTVPHRVNLAL